MSTIQERLQIYTGDITKMGLDAIVNAANPSLLGGSGVDGAIHMAAGSELRDYCRTLRGCAVGQAKITPGFELAAGHIIHTVGPIWQGGNRGEPQKLADCYRNSLQLAVENKLETIAFPAISTGAYGYPKEAAATIAVTTVLAFLANDTQLTKVYLVAFDQEEALILESAINNRPYNLF